MICAHPSKKIKSPLLRVASAAVGRNDAARARTGKDYLPDALVFEALAGDEGIAGPFPGFDAAAQVIEHIVAVAEPRHQHDVIVAAPVQHDGKCQPVRPEPRLDQLLFLHQREIFAIALAVDWKRPVVAFARRRLIVGLPDVGIHPGIHATEESEGLGVVHGVARGLTAKPRVVMTCGDKLSRRADGPDRLEH